MGEGVAVGATLLVACKRHNKRASNDMPGMGIRPWTQTVQIGDVAQMPGSQRGGEECGSPT